MRKKKSIPLSWEIARDVAERANYLIRVLELDWIDKDRIIFFRSYNSQARAYARIWGLSRVWQLALNIKAHYVMEVLSEKFDNLTSDKKDEVIIHELVHIPKNFSGSLMPHTRRGIRNFHDKVENLYYQLKKLRNKQNNA